MDESRDFIQWLGQDMSMKILMYMEDPSDLVRTSAVSRSWRRFVIANALCKKLCLKLFPEASKFDRVIEIKDKVEPMETGMEDPTEWAYLEREHRAYASLSRNLMTSTRENCISDAICASSTDNYPEESIKHTLEPSDRIGHRASYWSSKGETYFQFGFPIYSAKAVRFKMGYPKAPLDLDSDERDEYLDVKDLLDEEFVWTYISPEFPMAQENCLQKFKLPQPVLCIGGIMRVELLGRVQTQEMDGLYYICINHVQVIGRPLSPEFDVEILYERGKCMLKYKPQRTFSLPTAEMVEAGTSSRSHFHRFSESLRSWEQLIVNTFRGAGPLIIDEYDSDYEYLD